MPARTVWLTDDVYFWILEESRKTNKSWSIVAGKYIHDGMYCTMEWKHEEKISALEKEIKELKHNIDELTKDIPS